MKEQKTPMTPADILEKYQPYSQGFTLLDSTFEGKDVAAAMVEYSDQQNAELRNQLSDLERENSEYHAVYDSVVKNRDELRERVKELEGALKQCRNAIDLGERIEKGQTVYRQVFGKAFLDMINNALK